MFRYSIFHILREIKVKKALIRAHIEGQPIEGFGNETRFLGMPWKVAAVLVPIYLILWALALIYLLRNRNKVGLIGMILAVLALSGVLGGPVVAFLIIFITSQTGGLPPV